MKIATLLCVVLAAAGVATPAQASTVGQAPAGAATFAVQAKAAGYSPKQASELQAQVDTYLHQFGGRQVAINKIVFDGGEVLLPLPGEARARELGTSPTAAQKVVPASSSAGLHCPYQYLCIFHDRNYTGPEVKMYKCGPAGEVRVIWAGIGSYADNETPYTYAHFHDGHGTDYEVATGGDVNPALNWWYVHDVWAC
ncbi:hypothetical protein ACIA58_17820 [Kribbella sp. NPDC051586]|uniref:hypothetical protein n=1 Tax=Kribbella sp. NPDC051586 TaxID=3364118 RepID=UPI0037BC6699